MKIGSWQKIEEAVAAASEISMDERDEWLGEFCAGDKELRAEIESLLAFESTAENFLEKSVTPYAAKVLPENESNFSGKRFGNYKITREIGRGGMGAVFLAERTDGEFEQQVALKIVRQTVLDTETENRFRRERQILARLNHPNIARLLDGGVSNAGEPFLAMEFIAGETLLEFADRQNLSIEERLRLFLKICSAVAFAHRNLIVHRDIKPSNILITKEGEPKLLDFGLAKILDFENDAAQTATAFRAMTPAYASPEQLRGETVTTTSDIYSLGVVLYELLAGNRPFNLKTNSFEEAVRRISTDEPTKPSKAERTNPQSAVRNSQLKGDLDNIILMSLRKEPERRYNSAEAFADDIERHLNGLPVSARQSAFRYRASKFVKRNKVASAAAVIIFLSLLGGVAATFWQARRAEAQRIRAEKRFADVRRLANSFLFEIHPQIENLPGAMTARETLVRRALEYLDSLAQESGDDRELQRELAAAYEKVGDVQGRLNQPNLGDVKSALAAYRKAQDLRLAVLAAGADEPQARSELANNYEQIGYMLWWSSDTKQALELYRKALDMREKLVAENPSSVDLRWRLGKLQMQYGDIPAWNKDTEKALTLYRAALENLRQTLAQDPNNAALKGDLARCRTRLADALKYAGDFGEAVRQSAEAIKIYDNLTVAEPDDLKHRRGVWIAYLRQCEVFLLEKNATESFTACGKMPALAESLAAAEPRNIVSRLDLAASRNLFGEALTLQKNYADAMNNFEKSLSIVRSLAAAADDKSEFKRDEALNYISIGKVLLELNQFGAALENQRKARAALEEVIGSDPQNSEPRLNLATVERQAGETYLKRRDLPSARSHLNLALDIFQKLDAEGSLNANDRTAMLELQNEISRLE